MKVRSHSTAQKDIIGMVDELSLLRFFELLTKFNEPLSKLASGAPINELSIEEQKQAEDLLYEYLSIRDRTTKKDLGTFARAIMARGTRYL